MNCAASVDAAKRLLLFCLRRFLHRPERTPAHGLIFHIQEKQTAKPAFDRPAATFNAENKSQKQFQMPENLKLS
ncbi:hypothetical protein [Beijerinckia mobilis]|uniref:hypothetical protein n=1 Tax=Beijerinckia mobilis TaxID=231434 RepID=UPI0012EBFB97|nr:hypothetical protein [Beijerinckia mobilis]